MRTDVKVGIAVGLFVAVVGLVYFLAVDTGEPETPTDATDENGQLARERTTVETVESDRAIREPEPQPDPDEPRAIVPRFGERGGPTDVPRLEPEVPEEADEPVAVEPDESDETDEDEGMTFRLLQPSEEIEPVEVDRTRETARARTYVVTEDDTTGFSGIARKEYGDAKYYHLIVRANPDVDSARLRAGQEITIPPLPSDGPPDIGGSTRRGSTRRSDGSRVYVVAKGDGGFWAIAEKEYGNGKYWTLIARANPDTDSQSLQPGDELILPPLPRDEGAAPSRTTADRGETAPTPPAGGRVYTVTDDDSTGYWGIAKKEYGDGKYHTLISQANPDVDSRRLRAGQKIVLPKLTPDAREAAASLRTATTGRGETETRQEQPSGEYVTPPPINLGD